MDLWMCNKINHSTLLDIVEHNLPEFWAVDLSIRQQDVFTCDCAKCMLVCD